MKDMRIHLFLGIFFLLGLMYGGAYRYADWSVIIYVFWYKNIMYNLQLLFPWYGIQFKESLSYKLLTTLFSSVMYAIMVKYTCLIGFKILLTSNFCWMM